MKLLVRNACWITEDKGHNTWKDLKKTPFYIIQSIPLLLLCLSSPPLAGRYLKRLDLLYNALYFNIFVPNQVPLIPRSEVIFTK